MIFVALGVLVLAALVGLGRQPWLGGPLLARARNRMAAYAMAAVAIVAAALDAARGGWLGGSILLSAGLWLATSARKARPVPPPSGMGRAEAASMLGISESAGRAEIDGAYKRLMLRVHPDQGGAAGLAAQLNAARAVMLGGAR
jgi:hypothetical protein